MQRLLCSTLLSSNYLIGIDFYYQFNILYNYGYILCCFVIGKIMNKGFKYVTMYFYFFLKVDFKADQHRQHVGAAYVGLQDTPDAEPHNLVSPK